MIMVTQLNPNILTYKDNGIIDDETRLKYMSFSDLLNSVSDSLYPYTKNIELKDLNLTKDYNFKRKINFKSDLTSKEKLEVSEYTGEFSEIQSMSFSKNVHKLRTKEEDKNIKLGLKIHETFEMTDFKNPDYSGMTEFEKQKIEKFINSGILENMINLYKEYEFIYEEENKEMHGIIDLLIEYEDKFSIIDYKLKNISDNAYIKQLTGYKNYIERITCKDVDIYLYSILDEELSKI